VRSEACASHNLHKPTDLFEEVTTRPRRHLIIITLEGQPSFLRRPNLLVCLGCFRIANDLRLMPAARTRRIHQQLRLARLIQTQEPERRFVHRLADRQDAVILQNRCFSITQCIRYPLTFFGCKHHAAEIFIHTMGLVKANAVLCNHVQFPAKRTKCLAMHAMRMTRRIYIWPSLVDSAVNRKRRSIDRFIALDYLALLIHQYQVGHADEREVRRQRVQPKVVFEYGIADGDVACDAFIEAARREDAVCCCEVLFAVEALVFERGELGVRADLEGFAGCGAAHGCDAVVVMRFGVVDAKAGGN
jgi:hypothetical protein